MNNKQRLVIAHVLHSRSVMAGAPHTVIAALSDWITQLEKSASDPPREEIGVGDTGAMELVAKTEGKVQ